MIVLWHRLIGGRITSQVPGADVGVRQEKRSHFGGRCQDLADMGARSRVEGGSFPTR